MLFPIRSNKIICNILHRNRTFCENPLVFFIIYNDKDLDFRTNLGGNDFFAKSQKKYN